MGTASQVPLIGRADILDQLVSDLDRRGGAVLVGRAAVGRTRLAEELSASHDGARWVRGRPQLSSVELGAFLADSADAATDADRARRIVGLADELVTAPLVVVDDAHLLDQRSLAVVELVLERGEVAVLVTARAGASGTADVRALGRRHRLLTRSVEPLDRADSRTLSIELLGRHGDEARSIEAAAGGLPGVMIEMAEAGIDATLAEIAATEIGDRPPDAERCLDLLAVGDRMPFQVVERLVEPGVLVDLERSGLVASSVDRRRTMVGIADPLHARARRAVMGEAARRAAAEALLAELIRSGQHRAEDRITEARLRFERGDHGHPELFFAAAEQLYAAFSSDLLSQDERGPGHESLVWASRLAGVASETGHFLATDLLIEVEGHRLRVTQQLEAISRLAALATTEAEQTRARARAASTDIVGQRDPAVAYDELVDALVTTTDPDSRRLLTTLRAWAAMGVGRSHETLALAHEVLDDPSSARADRLAVATPLISALALQGRTEQAMEAVEAAIAEVDPSDDPATAGAIVIARLTGLSMRGDLEAAIEAARQALAVAEAVAHDFGVFATTTSLAALLLSAGRLDESLALGERAMSLADPAVTGYRQAAAHLTRVRATRGDAAGAREAFERIEQGRVRFDFLASEQRRAEAWLAVIEGRTTAAVELLHETAATEAAERPLVAIGLLHDIVRLGLTDVADTMGALARECDDLLSPIYLSHAEALAAQDGKALDAASADFEAAGAWLWAAEAAGQAVACHSEAGLNVAAAESARRSADLTERCGGAKTPALLHQWSVAELTRRELEVARLAVAGHADRAIAELLGVSVRTVESHLYRTYAKLAVSNRDELATVLGVASPELQ